MRIAILLFAVLLGTPAVSSGKAPFTFDAMMKLARISEPQLNNA